MNIVVTDGFTLNQGDLSWEPLQELGNLTIYDRTAPDEIIERCLNADIVLTNKVPLSKDTIDKLPQLKMVGVLATGFNIVNIEAARTKGIAVCNVPDYSSDSVAQHTFAFILEFANQVGLHSSSVRRGEWERCPDFAYSLTPLMEIAGKTLGLVGFGNIGKKVASIAHAFGMKVLYYTPTVKEHPFAVHKSLEDLFSESDFISLHLPLKPDNKEFVNQSLIEKMKKTAFLINTSRGPLIHEASLATALNEGQIAGAGLDVLSQEPPSAENPLLSAKNCFLTPHNAWMSFEARKRIIAITRNNILGFKNNKTINVVNS